MTGSTGFHTHMKFASGSQWPGGSLPPGRWPGSGGRSCRRKRIGMTARHRCWSTADRVRYLVITWWLDLPRNGRVKKGPDLDDTRSTGDYTHMGAARWARDDIGDGPPLGDLERKDGR